MIRAGAGGSSTDPHAAAALKSSDGRRASAASFNHAIEVASNHDGDSDSTASMAGQLYGVKHGLAALPAFAIDRSGHSRMRKTGHQLPVCLASQISMKRTLWKPNRISSIAVGAVTKGSRISNLPPDAPDLADWSVKIYCHPYASDW
jgi:hypothetical protein